MKNPTNLKNKLYKSTRAISKIISVLLMIAIAIAAALVAYSWIMGYIGSTSGKSELAIQIQSIGQPSAGGSWLTIYVQNVGKGLVNLRQDSSVYVNDILHQITQSPANTQTYAGQILPIQVGETREIVVDYWYMPGTYLKIKIVTEEGTFMETVIHGQGSSDGTTNPTEQYTLNINTVGSGAITKSPNKVKYNSGESVQLITSAVAGWQFDHWNGDLTGTATPGTILMDSDKTVTATFTRRTYELKISKNGEGTITKNPDKTGYYLNEQVQLTATPASDWSFAGWSGAATGTSTQVTVTILGNTAVTATFTQGLYSLTVTPNPPEGGYVDQTDYGPFDLNDPVTLTAYAAEGFTFAGWSGSLTGTANPADIKITGNMVITANFAKTAVTLSLNANPQSGGSIAADNLPPYKYGDTVKLTAINNVGYSFSGWSGDLTGVANPAWITLNGNKAVTANFIQNEYGLRVFVTGEGSVTRSPDQATYRYGDRVQLTATPASGWSFAGWRGDAISTNTRITLTIDETPEITAIFVETPYTLTVVSDPIDGGSTTLNPPGPNYSSDTVVTLTPNPSPNYRFVRWSGDIEGTTIPGEITITRNMIVTAHFEKIPVTLTLNVNPSGGGSAAVLPSGQRYKGDTVQLIATPSPGYSFNGWTGGLTSSNNPATITLTGDITVTANFNRETYTLTTNTQGSGTVTKSPNQATYYYGDEVDLTATPASDWSFAGWSGAATGTSTQVTVTIQGNTVVTATFTQVQYVLTTTPYPAGSGTISRNPNQPTYASGTVVRLTASPATGFHFVNWEGSLTGTANPADITITGNMAVRANFAPNPVTLTLNVNPSGGGSASASPGGQHYYGDTVQLIATPAAGYAFTGWTGTGGFTSSSNPASITLTGDTTVAANFAFGTGFDGSPWDQGWNNWANPPWHNAIGQGYLNSNAASSSSSDDGPFSSNAIDTRSANTITIAFKWKVQNTEAADLEVLYSYLQNPNSGGNSRDFYLLRTIGQPSGVSGATSLGNGWYELTITLTRTSTPNAFSQYFRLRFESDLSSGEQVWVDDIRITLT